MGPFRGPRRLDESGGKRRRGLDFIMKRRRSLRFGTVTGMSSAGTRPLRKDAERNLRRILDAAKEVFATHGLAVTMDDVAHHAGVGVGTVYRRFANKDELIE